MCIPSSNRSALAVFLCAFGLRIGFCAATGTLGRTPESGYREYVLAGERLLQRGAFISPLILDDSRAGESSLLPPAYVAFVAGAYGLFGVESSAATLVLQFANAAATSLAASLVLVIGGRLAGRRAGWTAAAIAGVNPTLIGYTSYIWETSLFTLGVVVTVWLSIRLARIPAAKWQYLAFGVWLGALALLNPALTITYPLLVLYPLIHSFRHQWKLIAAGVAASVLGWVMAITPWTIRNVVRFDELIYVRSGFMLELWLGVCPEADAHGGAVFPNQFPLNNDDVQRSVADMGEPSFIAECGRKSKEAIADDPLRFGKLVFMRIADYWTGASITHAEPDGRIIPRSKGRLLVMLFLCLEVGVLLVALLARRDRLEGWRWLFGIVMLFSIVYCVTHVQVRFRSPSEPMIAILVGMAIFGRPMASRNRSN